MCERWGNLEDGSCEDVIGRGSHDRRLGLRPALALGLFELHAVSKWPKPSKPDSSDVRVKPLLSLRPHSPSYLHSHRQGSRLEDARMILRCRCDESQGDSSAPPGQSCHRDSIRRSGQQFALVNESGARLLGKRKAAVVNVALADRV